MFALYSIWFVMIALCRLLARCLLPFMRSFCFFWNKCVPLSLVHFINVEVFSLFLRSTVLAWLDLDHLCPPFSHSTRSKHAAILTHFNTSLFIWIDSNWLVSYFSFCCISLPFMLRLNCFNGTFQTSSTFFLHRRPLRLQWTIYFLFALWNGNSFIKIK